VRWQKAASHPVKKKLANIEKKKKIKHESTTMGIVHSTLRVATTPYTERSAS